MIEVEHSGYGLQVEKLGRIVEPMLSMIGKLPPLESYCTLIGDDVSARIPTLVMRKVINYFRLQKNLPRVTTYFIVGGEYLKRDIVEQRNAFFSRYGQGWGKTLYLTEYVELGMGTKQMAEGLTGAGVNFDIAAISIAFNPANSLLPIARQVKYGEIGHIGAVLHHDVKLAGVTKYDHHTSWQMSRSMGLPFGLCAQRRQDNVRLNDYLLDEGEIVRWGRQTEITNRLAHVVIDSNSRYAMPEKGEEDNLFIKARKDVEVIADYLIKRLI